MPLPRFALLACAALLWTGCGDDDTTAVDDATEPPLGQTEEGEPADGEMLLESQASLGEPVVYQGAEDSDAQWELTVTAQSVECDVDVQEIEVEPAQDRLCAVHLQVENTGDEPNVSAFSEASSVVVDDGSSHLVDELATGLYAEQHQQGELTGIPPGETTEQSLIFSIPAGAEPTHLQLQASPSDDVVVIELSQP